MKIEEPPVMYFRLVQSENTAEPSADRAYGRLTSSSPELEKAPSPMDFRL